MLPAVSAPGRAGAGGRTGVAAATWGTGGRWQSGGHALPSSWLWPPPAPADPLSGGPGSFLPPPPPQICCSPSPPSPAAWLLQTPPGPPFPPSSPSGPPPSLPDCYRARGRRRPRCPRPRRGAEGPRCARPRGPSLRLVACASPALQHAHFLTGENQTRGNDPAFIVEIKKRMWGEGGGRPHPFIGGKCFNNFCWITLQLNKTDIVINKIFKN